MHEHPLFQSKRLRRLKRLLLREQIKGKRKRQLSSQAKRKVMEPLIEGVPTKKLTVVAMQTSKGVKVQSFYFFLSVASFESY